MWTVYNIHVIYYLDKIRYVSTYECLNYIRMYVFNVNDLNLVNWHITCITPYIYIPKA